MSELDFAGRPLVVYNTHLESRSYGRIQNEQLNEILADLARNYPPETAVLLGGDLNTKYLPSWFLRKLEKMGFRSALGQRVERTHKIAFALDWIFVRGPLDIESGTGRKELERVRSLCAWSRTGQQTPSLEGRILADSTGNVCLRANGEKSPAKCVKTLAATRGLWYSQEVADSGTERQAESSENEKSFVSGLNRLESFDKLLEATVNGRRAGSR